MTSNRLMEALWWGSMLFGALATIVCWRIVYETNKYKSGGQHESYLGWRLGKMERIFTEYEQRFPNGRKLFWFKLCFIAAGWLLGLWFFLSFWYSK